MLHRSIRPVLAVLMLLIALLPAAPDVPLAVYAQDPCDGVVAPRLQVGQQARVTTTYGLSLKNEPWTGAAGAVEITLLPFDAVATVLDGSRCNYGYRWWQLRLADGTVGWAAEGGSADDYYMEPVIIGLHVFRPNEDRSQIAHYFVTADGRAEPQIGFTIPAVQATPGTTWQLVEVERMNTLLDAARTNCPDRLTGTPFEGVAPENVGQIPLPTDDYDIYPAPDGSQLLLVRHLHLLVPRCDTVIPERVGISRVTVVGLGGGELELFPFPQHGTIPDSTDVYKQSEPGEWNVYLDEVVWSPHSKYVAFVAAYRDQCGNNACFRFHVYVANLETGELYPLGEGRHVGWTSGGEGINLFRLMFDAGGQQAARLFTMRPNGWDSQEIWLPGGAEYLSNEQYDFGFPWNASGTRVMVANAGMGEVMLLDVASRDFTSRVVVPDRMPQPNRLAVYIVRGETEFFWATIRGEFAVQNVNSGHWDRLESELASTGVAPVRVRPFATGTAALVEMADGSAYVLNLDTDTLIPVRFGE